MVSLFPWTKKSGRCREVAARLYGCILKHDETGYNENLQQAIFLVFLVTVSMQRAAYNFLCFWKSTRAFKIWLNLVKCDFFGERLSILQPFSFCVCILYSIKAIHCSL